MTFTNVVTNLARQLLNDTGATPRWTDSVLLNYLNAVQRLVRSIRTDAAIDSTGQAIDFADATTTSTLVLPDRFMVACASGVAWFAFRQDFGDAQHRDMAERHKQDFFDIVKLA